MSTIEKYFEDYHKLSGTNGWNFGDNPYIRVDCVQGLSWRKRFIKITDLDKDYELTLHLRNDYRCTYIETFLPRLFNDFISSFKRFLETENLTRRYQTEKDMMYDIKSLVRRRLDL